MNPRDVLKLQAYRSFPSVSVLMTTTPGQAMTDDDRARMTGLLDQVGIRLRRSARGHYGDKLEERLRALAGDVAGQPVDLALGLFVGVGVVKAIRLGVPVTDRAVVESSFVTRDLVYALQRTPRHLVLVLDSREARLFDAVNGALRPAATSAFPCRAARSSPGAPAATEPDAAEFLRSVDRRLGTYRALHPSPIVLVGPAPVLSTFTRAAKNLYRLAGTLSGDHVDASLAELGELTKPVLHGYLSSREEEAMELLERRAARGRVASGMQQAWLAARTEKPEMLAVEHTLFYPATLSPDGHRLTPTTDLDDPAAISDAVDELIEHVLIRGGWVAIVDDTRLADHHGVALALA